MRFLDAVAAPTVAGLGLTAILFDLQSTSIVVNGFPVDGPAAAAMSKPLRRQRHSSYFLQQHHSELSHHSRIIHSRLLSQTSKEDEFIDAIVEEKTAGLSFDDGEEENTSARRRKRDVFKKALGDVASLSLVDYKWRSALFKKNEANRMEEEWMASMMGEDPAYARPMDAGAERRGPLGNAEKSAVQWLTDVIEEEGKRAKLIAESNGELIRPKDLSPGEEAGPLSELERRAIQFLSEITDSEVDRVRSGTIRPKDAKSPGPLGAAEARAVLALDKVIESEKFRMVQSRQRGGEVVRPIDVPGPLGEFERYIGDIIRAERQRVKDRETNDGKLVRPKDASIKSGLSEIERKAAEDWELLRNEEKERYFSFQRFLMERRPMETDKDSPLGVTEAFAMGVFRGPQLLGKVLGRVKELMSSEELEGQDVLEKSLPASSSGESEPKGDSAKGGQSNDRSSEDDAVLP